jgi:hypothetical protein
MVLICSAGGAELDDELGAECGGAFEGVERRHPAARFESASR